MDDYNPTSVELARGNLTKLMAIALNRENYILHKVHSLTGIIPVGYYMVQHLALNTFSLGGREKFDGVINFFEGIPKHMLLTLEVFAIWIPLLFHAIYGLFIVNRGQQNYFATKYKWSQNLMYSSQRWSGIFIFFFLCYHVTTTTGQKYFKNDAELIKFDAWHEMLTSQPVLVVVYALGVLTASYHLAYGIWNFCIRWGITISDSAQVRIQKFAAAAFIGLTLMGWLALFGFIKGDKTPVATKETPAVETQI